MTELDLFGVEWHPKTHARISKFTNYSAESALKYLTNKDCYQPEVKRFLKTSTY